MGPGASGDGIRLAEAAGAAIGGFGAFYGHVHHRAAMQNAKLWPYPHLDAVAEVALLIGPDGRRFTDEGLGGVCQANAIARLADPLNAYLIMDDAMWQAEPKLTTTVAANSAMVTAGGALVSAPDLETLAAKIGVPASALAETVRAHNEAVAANDFLRLAIRRSVKKHRPMAFAAPPYHAVPLCAGITGTMGGVVIDAQARAQKREGGAFEGLYAVGTPVAGLEGGPRAGYVGGLSKAFILGLLAAEDAGAGTMSARVFCVLSASPPQAAARHSKGGAPEPRSSARMRWRLSCPQVVQTRRRRLDTGSPPRSQVVQLVHWRTQPQFRRHWKIGASSSTSLDRSCPKALRR